MEFFQSAWLIQYLEICQGNSLYEQPKKEKIKCPIISMHAEETFDNDIVSIIIKILSQLRIDGKFLKPVKNIYKKRKS